jgi:SAM-dependent methyltransferase
MMTEFARDHVASVPVSVPHGTTEPSEWVARWLRPAEGTQRLLDVASGAGRHARLGVSRGYASWAVDRDLEALARLAGSGVSTVHEDLEQGADWSFATERFDVIVCTNYLFRTHLDRQLGLLAPGGMWLYETFAVGNERFGRPANPDFLLRPGELLDVAARGGLHILAYEDGIIGTPRQARVQRIVALRPPWTPEAIALG